MTWYMRRGRRRVYYARPRVIRGTQVKPLPLLPSGPGGVCSRPLHEARSLTTIHASRSVNIRFRGVDEFFLVFESQLAIRYENPAYRTLGCAGRATPRNRGDSSSKRGALDSVPA